MVVEPYILVPMLTTECSHTAMGPRIMEPSITSACAPMCMGPWVVLRKAPSTVAPSPMYISDGSPMTVLVGLSGCEGWQAMRAKSAFMASPLSRNMS